MTPEEKIKLLLRSGNGIPGDKIEKLAAALTASPPVSIRYNPFKSIPPDASHHVPWEPSGCYLDDRPLFAADPAWHTGAYYVQEASSMFAGYLFKVIRKELQGPIRILDLCAAPGGKSTHILSYADPADLIVSNEITGSRLPALVDNITRWGRSNIIITHDSPANLSKLKGYFDVIFTDVPCSGEGMIRKDPVALEQWSPGLVKQCESRQREILPAAWEALKSGGFLIYTTCTFNRDENEENIEWLTSEYRAMGWKHQDTFQGIVRDEINGVPTWRFFPDKIRGEGFFASVMQKPASGKPEMGPAMRTSHSQKQVAFLKDFSRAMAFEAMEFRENTYLLPATLIHEAEKIDRAVRVIKPGLEAGLDARKEFIPAHALALSSDAPKVFPTIELSGEQALAMIRKEQVPGLKAQDIPARWTLATFGGNGLGWLKQAGQRVNNNYPAQQKLRNH